MEIRRRKIHLALRQHHVAIRFTENLLRAHLQIDGAAVATQLVIHERKVFADDANATLALLCLGKLQTLFIKRQSFVVSGLAEIEDPIFR